MDPKAPGQKTITGFRRNTSGNVAVVLALATPALLGATGLALDYANWTRSKTILQNLADQAALTGARELRLGNSSDPVIAQVVLNAVSASAASLPAAPSVTTVVAADRSNVSVTLAENVATVLPQSLGLPFATVRVNARARVLGGSPLCLLSLDRAAASGLNASLASKVTASSCSIYSNAASPTGVAASDTSRITSDFTCSAGGVLGSSLNFSPMPRSDCPALADPLQGRPPPPVSGSCDYVNAVIPLGSHAILPGTYCGGLNLALGARVTMSPGVYVMKDGPLTVSLDATLKGSDVGIYMTGPLSVLAFIAGSNIDLSAPVTGPMAGILVWEDAKTAITGIPHVIYSAHAHNLLGTIYLPKGNLTIGSPNPVADQSAYTIIVANNVSMISSPNLVLNSNYGASLAPVPDGLGNRASSVALDR